MTWRLDSRTEAPRIVGDHGRTVVFARDRKVVRAYATATGTALWEASIPNRDRNVPCTLVDEQVLCDGQSKTPEGARDYGLAIDCVSGQVHSFEQPVGLVLGRFARGGERYCRTLDGELHLDTHTHKIKGPSFGKVVMRGSRVYGTQSGSDELIAYDASSDTILWRREMCGPVTEGRERAWCVTPESVVSYRVSARLPVGDFVVRSARDGSIRWRADADVTHGQLERVAAQKGLLVRRERSYLTAHDETTGETLWRRFMKPYQLTNFVVTGDVLWIGGRRTSSSGHSLFALDLATGTDIDRIDFEAVAAEWPLRVLGDTLACAVGKSIHFYRSSA